MKQTTIGFMSLAIASVMVSCGGEGDENATNEAEKAVVYNLDKEASSLKWHGQMSPTYGHDGTVEISEGSVTMEGENLKSGTFTIDMSSITSTDIEDDAKRESLDRHLKGLDDNEMHKPDDFFNINKFPNVKVTLNDYEDGKLGVTLGILGQELKQDINATMNTNDKGAMIKGKFQLDLSSLNIKGFAVNPETGAGISPKIDFDLMVKLNK